jgi:GTPase SAR1 family protein
MPVPEIIIMGEQSSGKSSVVEGFVGQKFNFISDGIATKVPLVLSLLSNPNFSNPKWELREDGEWKELSLDEVKKHVSFVNGTQAFHYFFPFRLSSFILSPIN